MKALGPMFVDMTWGAGGSTADVTLDISAKCQNKFGLETNMHLTCTNMPQEQIKKALASAKEAGIRNILALRGDPPHGEERWEATEGGFNCALDLVKYIRKEYGDYFGVSVAGYPEGHPNTISLVEGGMDALSEAEKGRCRVEESGEVYVCPDSDFEAELDYLKEKVDAGADFIVTQMFFDAGVYESFVKACKAKGINVPVIPGLMCVNAYGGFVKMTKFCKTRVPAELASQLAEVAEDADAVKKMGIKVGIELSKRCIAAGAVGVHYYCLNLEKVVSGIVEGLDLAPPVKVMPKIIDVLAARKAEGKASVSLEFFPPRTAKGVENLMARLQRMKAVDPVFADFTWGAGGSTSEVTLELTKGAKQKAQVNPNMHLTCTNMPKEKITGALQEAREAGVTNIVALRGDPPHGEEKWEVTEGGFSCALDLVKFIRQEHGDFFGISVAGYPEGHPDKIVEVAEGEEGLSEGERKRCRVAVDEATGEKKVWVCRDAAFEEELTYLKEKVDAGADFIITQMFFDVETYVAFVEACRRRGINCPVVPGIMCINAYAGMKKMTDFCKTRVPSAIWEALEPIREDAAAVKQFGVHWGTTFCNQLLEAGAPVLHFYTLNLETVTMKILEGLGLYQPPVTLESLPAAPAQSTLPPAPPTTADKSTEVATTQPGAMFA